MGKTESWARAHKGLVALMAAGAAAVGVLLFLLHPKGQQAAQSALSSLPGVGPSVPNQPGSTPAPSSTTDQGFWGTIRGIGAVPAYDVGHSGIPLWSGLGTGSLESFIPWGERVQILNTRQGNPNLPGGPTTWYQVMWGGVTGWISAFDLAGFLGTPPASSAAIDPFNTITPAGPTIALKQQLSNAPKSSAVMSGVG